MITDEIKILLGDAADAYTDAQISLAYRMSLSEIEDYCKRDADTAMELLAEQIAVIKLNRINTEGLASQSYSGVGENYIDGYPDNIKQALSRKRKVKVI